MFTQGTQDMVRNALKASMAGSGNSVKLTAVANCDSGELQVQQLRRVSQGQISVLFKGGFAKQQEANEACKSMQAMVDSGEFSAELEQQAHATVQVFERTCAVVAESNHNASGTSVQDGGGKSGAVIAVIVALSICCVLGVFGGVLYYFCCYKSTKEAPVEKTEKSPEFETFEDEPVERIEKKHKCETVDDYDKHPPGLQMGTTPSGVFPKTDE